MKKKWLYASLIAFTAFAVTQTAMAAGDDSARIIKATVTPDADNAGLVLPSGFKALQVADGIGKARHIAVTAKGDIYVKLQRTKDGKGILLLKDTNGDGKADNITGFGNFNGTGITIKNDYLYASSDSEVFRYKLDAQQQVVNKTAPEKIITGLLFRRQHESKSIVLDNNGNIYVNIGAPSNSCQEQDRQKGSKGKYPCPLLDYAAGIWQFKADKPGQNFTEGTRYATGLRNVVGLDWNNTNNQLFVMQHGRDGLFDMFPEYYNEQQGAELPAECLYALKQGDDAGWPYIYYDQLQKNKMVAPEYGGDGKKTGGEKAINPIYAFPGHLAPNGLLFYTGTMFPEKYRNGAFIAFHGSWNRSPQQQGYFVAFVPFKDGKPAGEWEIFANNFALADKIVSTGEAKHRPCGLAQGPDGSLYVSDDVTGRIYRIIYQ
ncbi:Glucose/arabinose dehydrogenase, beta-propeller fold [Filimonas lacunae]|uniref:Glucose/arabinose dehydrogenase, beta-propeller fold n=1 Tax=Filimonas lacunae TaxID=477680 RepID=A0A173MKJ8_9BACT|nr:PQQ-dependent sugar dehydrogenase [Filimonas lacunae]BAV08163.1 L-sorbosone dehydrogenase [Filimonas lacunae]SIT10184.1 Glucose/arabinose dehydrogenase, beta-propeller fold [Filimonas lacunae]